MILKVLFLSWMRPLPAASLSALASSSRRCYLLSLLATSSLFLSLYLKSIRSTASDSCSFCVPLAQASYLERLMLTFCSLNRSIRLRPSNQSLMLEGSLSLYIANMHSSARVSLTIGWIWLTAAASTSATCGWASAGSAYSELTSDCVSSGISK